MNKLPLRRKAKCHSFYLNVRRYGLYDTYYCVHFFIFRHTNYDTNCFQTLYVILNGAYKLTTSLCHEQLLHKLHKAMSTPISDIVFIITCLYYCVASIVSII